MTRTLNVLIVEDNPADAELIRELLSHSGQVSFAVEPVSRLSHAIRHARERKTDLVLLDLGLPDSQGLATLTSMKAAVPEAPIIVLTGDDDQAVATSAVRDGAQDYLVKGQIVGNQLVRYPLYAIERKQLELAHRQHVAELLERNEELTRFSRAATDRELRMIELKQEVNALRLRLGEAPAYVVSGAEKAV